MPSASEFEEIPVEELIRLTREFTRRIINQDRQRLGLDLRESGHSRSLQITAPIALQQFFSGEIDLDTDLARRFMNAPLLSSMRLIQTADQSTQRQATALFSSNDDSFTVTVDALAPNRRDASLEFTFTMFSALGLRFRLAPLVTTDRSRWLELMRRPNGIAFLWTRGRWEQPYLICVVREQFARLYAFSPHGVEAAVRLTPDMVTGLVDWLEGLWFPDRVAAHDDARLAPDETVPEPLDLFDSGARPDLPDRAEMARRAANPDAPEEQWADEPGAEWNADFDDGAPPTLDEMDLSVDDLEW